MNDYRPCETVANGDLQLRWPGVYFPPRGCPRPWSVEIERLCTFDPDVPLATLEDDEPEYRQGELFNRKGET